MNYFAERKNEIYVFDTHKKEEYEIFESLRIYLERVSIFH
jgi:hypothetical protein